MLVINFKRFSYDSYGRTTRISKNVSFPLRLEIKDFMSPIMTKFVGGAINDDDDSPTATKISLNFAEPKAVPNTFY